MRQRMEPLNLECDSVDQSREIKLGRTQMSLLGRAFDVSQSKVHLAAGIALGFAFIGILVVLANVILLKLASNHAKQFKIFHINLSWECMALPPFGSGKYASAHCKAGSFSGVKTNGTVTSWAWTANPQYQSVIPPDWKEGEAPWSRLISSCSNTFLQSLATWNTDNKFDVIAMSELGNPGVAGMQYLGREPHTLPRVISEMKEQQMDPVFYQYLSENLLKDYGVFGNVVVRQNIVIQATYWKKSSLGYPTIAVGVDMLQDGTVRPVSALFFASQKLLLINVHSAHFRKTLIGEIESFGPSMRERLKSMGKFDNKFSLSEFTTVQLQELFGQWITRKILDGLGACKKFGLNSFGYCSGMDESVGVAFAQQVLAQEASAETGHWKAWKIIAAGDFNDETNELSQFKIFDVLVTSGKRKRTCCSDRDTDFKKAYEGEKYEAGKDEEFYSKMTVANADYLVNACGYFKSMYALKEYLMSSLNPMQLPGAIKVLANGEQSQSTHHSHYPFPSDMILSSENLKGSDMDFPLGYSQNMSSYSKMREQLDPLMKDGTYASGMISDHDPIQRVFDFYDS
mmetsp:Transcript_109331/g.189740  ORF Transcript_109331/g.189740 Transcript_109331/m.189740 type:complete len:571 (-) Transcript_109331:25-1737(-)